MCGVLGRWGVEGQPAAVGVCGPGIGVSVGCMVLGRSVRCMHGCVHVGWPGVGTMSHFLSIMYNSDGFHH